MLTVKDINNLYEKYQVQASKRFGQNFLIDHQVIHDILASTNIVGESIIEIGPGLGSLTGELLKHAKALTAYEIDQDMIRVLKNEIKDKSFDLVEQDFLKANFNWKVKKKIIANIPYNITSPIIFKILKHINAFESATLMVQKEYGERLLAQPGSKDYGKLSVSVNSCATVSKVVDVSRDAFVPSPKVDSVVVKITFNQSKYNPEFFEFIKKCFSFRRKTLVNNMLTFTTKTIILKILDELEIKNNARPQELTVTHFQDMYKLYLKQKNA